MPLPASVLADPTWARLASGWKPIPKRPGYILGLLVMGLVIVLVPVLYFGIIALIAIGTFWPVFHLGEPGRIGAPLVFGAVLLAILGVVLVLFLLKPLVAHRPRSGRPVELAQFEELKLHSFVENVCTVLEAPVPAHIYVDCDVNAGAGFEGGLFGLLFRRRATLTIGLPLVAAMTKREFAGVLAHEFGHFSQGTGSLISYLARRVVGWLARAVGERDGWDAILEAMSRSGNFGLVIAALHCKIALAVTRLVLLVVLWVAAAMCTVMLKELEYDSDRYQARLAGSASLPAAFARLDELGAAYRRAVRESTDSFARTRRLPDDFPAFLAAFSRRLTPEARDEIRREAETERFSLISTHPPTRTRIARVQELNEPGLYTDDSPAQELFGDFPAASRKATRALWKAVLGPYAVGSKLEPVAPAADSRKDVARQATLPRYLGFEPPTWRPVFPTISSIPSVEDARPIVDRLRAARRKLKELAPEAIAKSPAYRKSSEEALKWEHARTIMDAGLPANFKALGIPSTTRAGVSGAIEKATREAGDAAAVIDEAGDVAMVRLRFALSMLGVAGIDKMIPDAGALRNRADRLLGASAALRESLAPAVVVRRSTACADALLPTIKSQRALDAAKKVLRPLSDEIRNRLDDVRRTAGGTPDPFAPSPESRPYAQDFGTPNMGESLVGATPGWRDFDDILRVGRLFADRYADMYRRILGELVEIAEQVERRLGAPRAESTRNAPETSETPNAAR